MYFHVESMSPIKTKLWKSSSITNNVDDSKKKVFWVLKYKIAPSTDGLYERFKSYVFYFSVSLFHKQPAYKKPSQKFFEKFLVVHSFFTWLKEQDFKRMSQLTVGNKITASDLKKLVTIIICLKYNPFRNLNYWTKIPVELNTTE